MKLYKEPLLLIGLLLTATAPLWLAGCYDDRCSGSGCDPCGCIDNPPAVPTGVYSVTGHGEVYLYWNPVYEDDMDVLGYGIYRCLGADCAQSGAVYTRIAEVRVTPDHGDDQTIYVDRGLVDGETYYYAVDAFDYAGNSSALSYELVHDTPRPEGYDLVLYSSNVDGSKCGLDFSAQPYLRVSCSNPYADVILVDSSGLLRFQPREITEGLETYWNDIQDFGYTETLDDIGWAPYEGWSASGDGVEVIAGHTYVVWTWDGHFAKIRVKTISASKEYIVLDWAYQVDWDNPELVIGFRPGTQGP